MCNIYFMLIAFILTLHRCISIDFSDKHLFSDETPQKLKLMFETRSNDANLSKHNVNLDRALKQNKGKFIYSDSPHFSSIKNTFLLSNSSVQFYKLLIIYQNSKPVSNYDYNSKFTMHSCALLILTELCTSPFFTTDGSIELNNLTLTLKDPSTNVIPLISSSKSSFETHSGSLCISHSMFSSFILSSTPFLSSQFISLNSLEHNQFTNISIHPRSKNVPNDCISSATISCCSFFTVCDVFYGGIVHSINAHSNSLNTFNNTYKLCIHNSIKPKVITSQQILSKSNSYEFIYDEFLTCHPDYDGSFFPSTSNATDTSLCGGAICFVQEQLSATSSLKLQFCSFNECFCEMAGGAVFLRGAINFVCENSSFLMCHATWQGGCGGGIFADRIDGQATFDKGSFMRCRAGKCGGGMFFSFEKTKLKQHKSENMEAAEMIEMTVTQNCIFYNCKCNNTVHSFGGGCCLFCDDDNKFIQLRNTIFHLCDASVGMSIVFQLSNVFNEFTASHFHFYYVAFKHNKELDYNSREKELFDDITPTNNDRNEDNEAAFGSFRAFNSEFMSQLQFMCNCSQLSDKPRINVLFWDAVGVWNPVGDFKPCDHSCWFGKRDGDAILLQKNAVTDVSSWLKNVTFFYIGGEDAIDSPACGMLQSLPCASLEPALNGRCEYETSLYIIGDVAPIKSQLLFFQERITFMVYKGVKPIEIHSRLQEQESVFSLFGTELVMMYASFYFGKSQVDSMVSFCYQHSIFSDKNVFLSFSSFNLTGPNAESSSGAMTTTFFYNPMFVIYNAGLSISDSTISHFSFSESPLISLRGKHYNLMLALAVFNDISTRKSQSAIVKINQTKADSSPLQFVCANSTFKSIKATSSNSGGAMDLLTNFYGDISLKHTAFQECEAEQTEFGRGGALFCTCDNLHATPLLKSMIFQDNLANCANDIFIICDSFTQINSSTISFEYSHCSVNEANSFMGRLKNKLDIVNLLPQIICYEAETIFTSSTHENASDEEKCGSLKLPCKTMDVASTHVNHTTLGRLLIIGNASIGRSSQLINTEISSFSDENSYFIFNNTMITTNVLTCSENVVFSSLYFLFDSCKLQNDESIFFVNGPTNISSSTFQQIESSSMNFDFQRLSSNEKQYLGIILLSVFETQLTLHDIRFIDFTVNKPLFLFYFNTSITMRNITFSSIELNETSIVQSVHNNNQPSIADFPIYSSMEDSISSFRYSLFRRQSDKSFSLMSVSRFDNDNSIQDINMKNIAFTNLSLSNSTLIFLDFPKTYSNTSFSMKEIKLSNIKLLSQQENPLFVYCKNNNFAIYQIYLDISDLFVSNCSVPKISGSLILASNVSFQLKYSQIMNQRLSQGTSCSKLQLTDKVKRSESIPQSLKSNQEVIRNGIERWKEEEEEEAADSICLWNTSIIQMKNCTSIVDNVQISGFSVGAFIIQGGTANITSCQFLNNSATENDMLISRNIVCRDNASIDFVNVTTSATDDSLWIVNEGCTFSGAFSTEEIFFAHPSLSNMTFDSQNGTCFLHFVGNNILPCNMTFSFVEYSKQPTEFIIDGTLTEFQGSTAAVGVIGQKTMSRIQYEHPNAAAAIVCWGANPLKNMTSNPIRLFSITPRDTPHFPTKIVVSIAVSVVFVIVCIIILSFIIASKWKRRKKKTGKACVDSGVFSVNRSNLISDTSQLLPTESIPSDVQEPNFEEDDEDFI